MNPHSTPSPQPGPAETSPEEQALQDAVAGLMASVARLAVARGLPYAAVDEMLKRAFVHAADAAHPGGLPHRKVSRISTATGINRREVTRLVQAPREANVPHGRSVAGEVFTHWRTQRPYRGRDGQPRTLPRQGPAPSFETLAHAVTRDVHPRSLLDELCRLGLAEWDEAADTVALAREAFVPQGDSGRMLSFLGDNVGDHLRAAVDNVLLDNRTHFEQAVFADSLTDDSLASVRPLVREQWQALLSALVPALEARVAADAERQPAPQGRLRVGLYTFQDPAAATAPPAPAAPRRAPRRG
jgi:hypothetical protein